MSNRNGFVFLSVVILLLSISLAVVHLNTSRKVEASSVVALERNVHGWLLAQAGLERAIQAYLSPSDELRQYLEPSGGYAVWEFDGVDIRLSVAAESGKLDLIEGNDQLIQVVMARLIGTGVGQENLLSEISTISETGISEDLQSYLETIVPLLSASGIDFWQFFTMYSGQRTVDPNTAHETVLNAIDSLSDTDGIWGRQLPVYTFSAQAVDARGTMTGVDKVVRFDPNGGFDVLSMRLRNLPLTQRAD